MATQQRLYDIDDLWEIVCQPENADKYFEPINGELVEMPAPDEERGFLAGEISFRCRFPAEIYTICNGLTTLLPPPFMIQ